MERPSIIANPDLAKVYYDRMVSLGLARILDIRDMPGYNPMVTNGVDSVSRGDVYLRVKMAPNRVKTQDGRYVYDRMVPNSRLLGGPGHNWVASFPNEEGYPWCVRHGALLRVSKDGIWRCGELSCSNGCFMPAK